MLPRTINGNVVDLESDKRRQAARLEANWEVHGHWPMVPFWAIGQDWTRTTLSRREAELEEIANNVRRDLFSIRHMRREEEEKVSKMMPAKNVTKNPDSHKEGIPVLGDSEYFLVQTEGPITKRQKSEFNSLQAKIQEHMGEDLYLVQFDSSNLQGIRGITCVKDVVVYDSEYKVSSDLRSVLRNGELGAKRAINVVLHAGKGRGSSVKILTERIAEAARVPQSELAIHRDTIKLAIGSDNPGTILERLAMIDEIRSIEDDPTSLPFNDIARKILGAGIGVGINQTLYQGEGQTVAVADTGLDCGVVENMHPAFNGRVKEMISIGRLVTGQTDDPTGHGTHVCGSILGAKVSGSKVDATGIAPGAKLVMLSLINAEGKMTTDNLENLFLGPYDGENGGARIHCNAWGAGLGPDGQARQYSVNSQTIDKCVREKRDLLICFAAGNQGHKHFLPTVGAEAAAKNCLTIGATNSIRPSIVWDHKPEKMTPNDPTEIAWYSNRGPTREGRIKPDLVAPGSAILSASSLAEAALASRHEHGIAPDEFHRYLSGTSMATGLVAGAATVVREVLTKSGLSTIPAALIKAILINGACTLHGGHGGRQGFGLVNLKNSIIIAEDLPLSPRLSGYVIGEEFDDVGQSKSTSVTIPSGPTSPPSPRQTVTPSSPPEPTSPPSPPASITSSSPLESEPPPVGSHCMTLKVTLVYNDAPGAILQNNLNLFVQTADGIQYCGNTGTSGELDQRNNVEQVVLRGLQPGKVTITVSVDRLTSDTQDYALVWRMIPVSRYDIPVLQ